MNAVPTSLSSPRTTRIIFWVGIALLIAAVVVFIIKKSQHSAAPATSKGSAADVLNAKKLLQNPQRQAPVTTNKQWSQLPASARAAVRTFIVDGAGERNLARAWSVTHPSLREGFTYNQWVKGSTLPFQVYPEMSLKEPMSFSVDTWSGNELFADVGIASKYKTGRGAYTFSVGAVKVGKGAKAHWLVNYWMAKYTPPVRADPSQSFGG
jgi:hypothetical protein